MREFQSPQWRHSQDGHQPGQQHQHSHRYSGITQDSPPDVKEGSNPWSRGAAKSHPPKKARVRPFSTLHGFMAGLSHHSPPKMNKTAAGPFVPETSFPQRRLSSPRPLTPSPPLRPQQYYNGNDSYESSPQGPQLDQQRFSSGILPPPKNYEQISAAQRMLYERHPLSPKNDRTSISSSSPTTASERRSSVPTSPGDHPTPRSHSKPSPLHSLNYHEESKHPSPICPTSSLIYENDFDNRLPQMRHNQKPLQGLELPSLSAMSLTRRQSLTDTMERQYSCSSARSSISSAPSSSTATILPISPNISSASSVATAVTAGNSKSTNGPNSGPQLQGTEGMTVLRSEEGAISVYNPNTATVTYRCELCPSESFGRIHDLKRHQASKHQEMTWPCDFCHRPFVRRDALLRHYTVKAARDDGLHPASHEVDRLLAARARAKTLY
ncbi:hypothetical protein BGZ51_003339 [Haplosporangium sp. Z 767]|nr:hypothetical protein BGZ51_003339 [Haplosporangium sp. Z 767]KAF9185071.1 hypothetical protein BGZ50_003279 [Haplosporangium sp. Z 11]